MNKTIFYLRCAAFTFVLFSRSLVLGQYSSSILHYDDRQNLVYHSDRDGNRIPDFSYAGYKYGEADLPELPVVLSIEPIEGDNTAHIQAAIDQVSAMVPDERGFRGAILLQSGLYSVQGSISIQKSGIVLRGTGEGNDPETNTIIVGEGTSKRKLIQIGSGDISWSDKVSESKEIITSEYIPVGSHTIEVVDASHFSVGDNIIIMHPSTQAWINAVNGGDTGTDAPWLPGDIDIKFNRYIKQIEGNKISFKTPIYHELDRTLSQAYIYKFTKVDQLRENGVENLRVEVETSGSTSEDHVETVINFSNVENCWIKNVTTLHFVKAGFRFEGSINCTVLNSSALEPHSIITGSRRYNFCLGSHCNNILFKGCYASEARHAYVSNGTSTVSGIVFTSCTSINDHTASESHRRWGEALLWDNSSFTSSNAFRILGLYNRGDYGTGHGWTGTHQVAWNVSAPSNQIVIQKPPIGQNYAIGCDATVDNLGPFSHPAGYIEGTREDMLIKSLYETQLSERLSKGIGPDTPGRLVVLDYSYSDLSGFVELGWLDIALDERKYVLERSSDGGITYEVIAEIDENVEVYRDDNILQENYHYRLRAVNDIGFSAWSNVAQTIKGVPNTDIEGALFYEIFPHANAELTLSNPPAIAWLANQCYGSDTNSNASDGSRSVLLKNNDSYLVSPEVDAPGVLTFMVKAKPPKIAGSYLLVEKSVGGGQYREVGRMAPQNTNVFKSFVLDVCDPSKFVKLRFSSNAPGGGEAKYYIDNVLLMEHVIGAKSLSTSKEFILVGNLVNDIMSFECKVDSGYISIFDINGRIVFSKEYAGMKSMNVSNLNSGIYFVLFDAGGEKYVERIYKR